MSDQPAIPTAVARNFTLTLGEQHPAVEEAARSLLDARVVAALQSEPHEAWLPIAAHMRYQQHVYERLGGEAFRRVWRRSMGRTFELPILATLLDAATRLFGAGPLALTKISMRAWVVASRNAGRVELEPVHEPGSAVLRLLDFPPLLFESRAFFEGFAGCYEAFYDVCGADGTLHIVDFDPETRSARFVLRWNDES